MSMHVKGVSKSFAGLKALSDVNLAIEEGGVHAIIGPNGAGKSTLLNCFVGRLTPDAGSVTFAGQSLVGLQPHEINQAGVARMFQTPEIFGDLSLLENVVIPTLARRDGAFAVNAWSRTDAQAEVRERAEHLLADVGLADKRHVVANSLSRGDKRRLELAMCLVQEPRLLLLDEPTAGMSRADTNNTIELLQRVGGGERHQGHHRARHARRVLAGQPHQRARAGHGDRRRQPARDQGRRARAASLPRGSAPVTDAILPSRVPAARTEAAAAPRAYFSCRNLHAYYGESYIVQGVSFDVREGEIVALLGRNGAGKTSTLRTIARLDDPRLASGEIWLDGQPLHRMAAWQAARHGVGLVPEDRRIIGGLTVEENLQLAQIEAPRGWSIERMYEHFPRLAERRRRR